MDAMASSAWIRANQIRAEQVDTRVIVVAILIRKPQFRKFDYQNRQYKNVTNYFLNLIIFRFERLKTLTDLGYIMSYFTFQFHRVIRGTGSVTWMLSAVKKNYHITKVFSICSGCRFFSKLLCSAKLLETETGIYRCFFDRLKRLTVPSVFKRGYPVKFSKLNICLF